VIFPGCDIGDGTVVGAGAIVPKNKKIEPGSVIIGVPAKNQ
jgi:carbonic anhydrase/acetyltransferase-like protein (isoleucine patch superfamily)